MFVSRKKYIHALEEWEKWENIATEARESAAQAIKVADKFEEVAISYQKDNRRILEEKKEMADTIRKTEAELTEMRRKYNVLRRDYEVLMSDYEVLDAEHIKTEEERDHYQERCAYLEDEVAHYEEEKAAHAADKIVEVGDMSLIISRQSGLSLELSATIAEALYDAGYKREEIV